MKKTLKKLRKYILIVTVILICSFVNHWYLLSRSTMYIILSAALSKEQTVWFRLCCLQ